MEQEKPIKVLHCFDQLTHMPWAIRRKWLPATLSYFVKYCATNSRERSILLFAFHLPPLTAPAILIDEIVVGSTIRLFSLGWSSIFTFKILETSHNTECIVFDLCLLRIIYRGTNIDVHIEKKEETLTF